MAGCKLEKELKRQLKQNKELVEATKHLEAVRYNRSLVIAQQEYEALQDQRRRESEAEIGVRRDADMELLQAEKTLNILHCNLASRVAQQRYNALKK